VRRWGVTIPVSYHRAPLWTRSVHVNFHDFHHEFSSIFI
jgi:hypothetical protein